VSDVQERGHEEWLDDVAVYALGSMTMQDAQRVRAHIATCQICRREYALLAPAVGALAESAEAYTPGNGPIVASPELKARIMRTVRPERPVAPSAPQPDAPVRRSAARRERPVLWPVYLVAAACLAIALISSISDVMLSGQLKQSQTELAQLRSRTNALASALADRQAAISDLLSSGAKHYPVDNGEVVRSGSRLYIAMYDLATPPRGHVYQAWTLPKGSKTMAPSLTFVPDSHGVAFVSLPAGASDTSAVAVSLEPEGGSKQPTTKPLIVVPLD
jgi:anti-sigma-K factor RskA